MRAADLVFKSVTLLWVEVASQAKTSSMANDIWQATAVEQRDAIAAREVSASELLEQHLTQVDDVNPVVNAIVGADVDVARATAAVIDQKLASGQDVGPLAGLVTAHKDLTETADFVTTYGCSAFADYRPPVDSLLVSRIKAAGAVAIGKTNTPEFGAGSHSFNPVYGTTVNPFDPGLSAGGSSGGAAAALRCGMVSIADGSDAGGSLRNPAAWNNVVGFRSSARVVPKVAAGNPWSNVAIEGPMARSVDDLVLLLGVLAQPDLRDPLNRPLDLPSVIEGPDRPLKVAWSPDLGGLPVDEDISSVLGRFIKQVEAELGWEIELATPNLSGAEEVFITLRALLFGSGIAAGLGERLSDVKATVRDEISRGQALTADQISRALNHSGLLWRRAVEFFTTYDLLIAPVTQVSPFPIDQEYPTEVAGKKMNHYIEWMQSNYLISAVGLPALSLPAGFTSHGLPVGAQLVGGPYGDLGVLSAAKAVETVTGHASRWPDFAKLARSANQ